MRRIGLWVSFFSVLGLPAWGAPNLYQPSLGDRFRYELSNGDAVETRVIRLHEAPGETIATLERTTMHHGKPQATRMVMFRSEEGLALKIPLNQEDQTNLSPLIFYWAKAEPQQGWLAQKGQFRNLRGETVPCEIQARYEGRETVTVPAGVFQDCRRITFWGSPQAENPTLMTLWLQPELGIIKTRSIEGTSSLETELIDYATATSGHSVRHP